jgi:UDP-N-acetylglucosamine--N-acetylmuramyl-(pentapeptide) pyrophosphoryl-undecaprenol N-acetylglucosamine transferase
MRARHVLIAGGGSGGHVFPGLAVAESLVAKGWQVSWLGRQEGMEKEIVEGRGIDYHGLPALAVVGRGPIGRLRALATLARSALAARSMIHRLEIGVVLGTGGFASVPGVAGARLAGRPSALLEPNAEPGAANRWLSRWSEVAATGYREAAAGLRCRVQPTGVPVREEFFAGSRRPPAESLVLLVLGGSQGASQLNRALPRALELVAPRFPELQVLHQVGDRHLEETREAYKESELGTVEIELRPFLRDVAAEMGGAHLVISRAGAVTLAEICAVGRAAVLVPLRLAAGHQEQNAERLAATGGAVVLDADDLTAERLAEVLGELLADRRRLDSMGDSLHELSTPGAAAAIADLVIELGEAA